MRVPALFARIFGAVAIFVGVAALAPAQQVQPVAPSKDDADDIWETVFVRDAQGNDQQIGFAMLRREPVEVDGKKLIRGTRDLRMTIRREGQSAQLKATTGTDETIDGKVAGVFMQQWIGTQQAVVMNGTVDEDGKGISVVVQASVKNQFKNPWNPKVIGLLGEATLLRDKQVKPGDKLSYQIFEPSISHVATINVEVKDVENVLLPRGGKRKLLKVESTPEKIQNVQLPASTIWADPETREPVMTQINMPGIGLLTLLRSNKKEATGPLGIPPDLMKLQTIRLGERISGGMAGLKSVTYKITANEESEPSKLIQADDRQTIGKKEGKSFEVTVESRKMPIKLAKEEAAADEFLASNLYINSDDATVKKLAAQAVGKIADPWDKAKAIERYVRANMKSVNYSEAMNTADHVAKTLSGDCSEYAMLTAAMCRAQGIPSRTALGVVYVDSPAFGGPALAFHMWTEVYVKGQWLGLDSTLGQGGIGPGHLKISDCSWHDERGFKPLLPVTGFIIAKPKIEIKSAVRE